MTVSVITPTCDRPVAFRLLEDWMRAQTRQPDEWIVADGGKTPIVPTCGQVHVHKPSPAGVHNFGRNLLAALDVARGDLIVIFEDDDAYLPSHLAQIVAQFDDGALIAGDDQQRYYNVPRRLWRVFDNHGASLCQTAIRRTLVPLFRQVIHRCCRLATFGIDAALWKAVDRSAWRLARTQTVIGIKGLPGQRGLGIGHRPHGAEWHADPSYATLRAWLGPSADRYVGALCRS